MPGGVCSLVNTKAHGARRQRKSCQMIVAAVVKTKAISTWRYVSPAGDLETATPGRTCPPPGDFAATDWCYTFYDVCDLQGF